LCGFSFSQASIRQCTGLAGSEKRRVAKPLFFQSPCLGRMYEHCKFFKTAQARVPVLLKPDPNHLFRYLFSLLPSLSISHFPKEMECFSEEF
jgi:hypothetical protein